MSKIKTLLISIVTVLLVTVFVKGAVAQEDITNPEAVLQQYELNAPVSATLKGTVRGDIQRRDIMMTLEKYVGEGAWIIVGGVRTNAYGKYTMPINVSGIYRLTPYKFGYTFVPQRPVRLINESAIYVVDFIGSVPAK